MDTFYRSPSNSDILASSGLQSNDTSTPRKPQFPESSVPQPIRPDESFLRVSMDSTESVDAARSILGLYADADMDPHQIGRHTTSVYSSTRTSALFSPSPTSSTFYSGYISPFHLEQPHTPVTIDFEECFLPLGQDSTPSQASNKEKRFDQQPLEAACLNPSGFDGYNLPDTEYASALTLRNTTSDDKKVASPVSAVGMRSSQDRVSSWNDGSAALEELFDELSYLGELII
ncbi:hypothetical protein MMC13_004805 [Lambiella insularis]|nr:hypothetical protein [Lambiella insularis]